MPQPARLNLRHFALASAVAVVMMIVAMAIKPLWRDEYFSLYFSDPAQSLSYLAANRWGIDAHPPAHNVFLWGWSHISDDPIWQKSLSLVFLALGAFTLNRLTPADKKRTLYIFLLICAGSYWVIYFATEIRPYILNFTLSAVLTFTALRLLGDEKIRRRRRLLWLIWILAGALLSLVHYFGALWFACLGFVLGVAQLKRGRGQAFIWTGVMTVIGLIPVALWLTYALPHMQVASIASELSFMDKLTQGSHQFLRGLIIKTFGSNPLITVLGFGGLVGALRMKNRAHSVLLMAVLLTVVMAFALHLFFVDMIKERAFIVIMPAILFILADHMANKSSSLMKYVPLVTVVMPFLFIPEYFKNKERIDEFQDKLASYGQVCQSAEILVYYRPHRPEEFFRYASEKIINPSGGRTLTDLRTTEISPRSDCPVIAAAVMLPKNDEVLMGEAQTLLAGLGYSADIVEVYIYGKGRSVLWIKKTEVEK